MFTYVFVYCTFFNNICLRQFTDSVVCTIKICNYNSVEVLCEDCNLDYKNAFEFFIEKELHRKIKWVNPKEELSFNRKYLLLCNIQTRIPEDVEFTLRYFGIKGNTN